MNSDVPVNSAKRRDPSGHLTKRWRLAAIQRKKCKPSHGDMRQVLVTYRDLRDHRREVYRNLMDYRGLLAEHNTGGIFHAKLHGRKRRPPFRHVPSPLSREVKIEVLDNVREEPFSLWGSVKGLLWNVWGI
ncbi:hypothetical protein N7535_006019 [Penicillium sp. DV-2018c]|nr:hypothetical protein N7461_009598 [Penicillium sp. DV-2018c]KAJ5572359.1 hypothetical protein N7535_006019 [Penicillium sp. DV-2018c]